MTKRKPAGMSWESWIERQIREAEERGEFDNLPGAGKPIPGLDKPYEELWWLKQKLKDEDLSVLPDTLQLKKDIEAALQKIGKQHTERGVRRIVAALNARIAEVNATATSGPASTITPIEVERVLRRWRDKPRRDGRDG